MDGIPNIEIKEIGTRRQPLKAIKGFIELPCWTGYFLTEEPNYLFKNKVVTNGRIDLWIDGEIKADHNYSIDPEQINAYTYLVAHAVVVKEAIVRALKNDFPRLLLEEYSSWDHNNGSFPKLSDLNADFDFKNYIGPASIQITENIKEDVAYIQWHFQCRWDPEHGFEVITHKERVIDISPEADIFKMHKDNGTYEALEKELENKVWKVPKTKKWWQFW